MLKDKHFELVHYLAKERLSEMDMLLENASRIDLKTLQSEKFLLVEIFEHTKKVED